MRNEVLEVVNVSKKFGNLTAVNNISFSVQKGDIFGFLGPNGSGKTTTIRMILGLLKPNNGEIYINKKSIKDNFYEAISQVGALVEGPAFYEYMTAQENLEIFGAYSGEVNKKKIQEILELVRLAERSKDKVKEFSLGMKQRLGIAQALLNEPKLLILDEPINGLDPSGIREIRDIICNLSKNGTTVFLSSHILSEVEQICNKILIINKGKEIISGITKDLIKNSNIYDIQAVENKKLLAVLKDIKEVSIKKIDASLRVEINEKMTPEDLLTQLINDGIKIRVYNPVKISLEDYFFKSVEEGD